PELLSIDIVENLGDKLPLDLQFTDDQGRAVSLSEYFGQDKPVLLSLGYYECPMLCNLVFNGISSGIKELGWVPGENYEVVSVSIDPTENSELAAAKKANYIKALELPGAENGWHFLVGDKSQSEALAKAVGFKYYYVEERDEYAHPAAVYLISPDGTISRYLYGIQYTGRNLKLGLVEASEGKVGSTIDRIILYCFHYDPEAKSYVLFAQNIMKLGGAATVALMSLFIGTLWVKDHLRIAPGSAIESEKLNEEKKV
ncbi:MAG TPA: SCO family protein, partial [candidate division Zixibacteria bacterium]|nr:SCO family protein [candidate division Zixibacteria bacterium]